jgi:hypothetical protein
MLSIEIDTIYFGNHTKHINVTCEKGSDNLNIKNVVHILTTLL